MIRAEYKNNHMTLEVFGSAVDIAIELDNLLHYFMETQPEIVNGCMVHEIENLSKSFEKCDSVKVTFFDLLLSSATKVE